MGDGTVLVVSSEALGATPAGPALRAAGLARGLAHHGLPVTLVAPDGSHAPDGCALAAPDELPGLAPACRCAIVSGFLLERHPSLVEAPSLCVDMAGPFLIENVVIHARRAASSREQILSAEAEVVQRLLASADLILCAHERQRDLLVGMLLATATLPLRDGEVEPDPAQLIAIVPFGAPTGERPHRSRGPDATLRLVWPGGMWDWLDPVTLIDAIASIREHVPVQLELWGTQSPDPEVPRMRMAQQALDRIAARGLGDVIEVVDWVPYEARLQRLARADVAVTLDTGLLEARYAFRTRLLDALWAGIPTLATSGEWIADHAAAAGAGWTVPPGRSDAVAEVLSELAASPSRVAEAARQAPELAAAFRYEDLVEPLVAWCNAALAVGPRRRAAMPRRPAGRRLLRRIAGG